MGIEGYNTCHNIGINGGCGLTCPVLIEGSCEASGEILESLFDMKMEDCPYEFEEIEEILDNDLELEYLRLTLEILFKAGPVYNNVLT